MPIGPLKKVAAARAADITAQFELSEPARALLRPEDGPAVFLDRLMEAGHLVDACRLMAFALPRREAVWWACLCARASLPAAAAPEVTAALKAAEVWVYSPNEENRLAAQTRAEAIPPKSPASWAAKAVAWSGGSLAPRGLPVVPPGETLTATAVFGAVMLAAAAAPPEQMNATYRRFLAQAIDVANGGTGRT